MARPVGDGIQKEPSSWTFGEGVPQAFDEHIAKSVPGYYEMHALALKLCDFFVRPDSVVYDVGSSTGSLTKRIAERLESRAPNARVIGVEPETDMVEYAQKYNPHPAVTYFAEDITSLELEPCSFVVLCLTAQFLHPDYRATVLKRIWSSLEWSGSVLMFEKTRGSDARFQDIFSSLYSDFKEDMGFTAEEIVAKQRSLRSVMEPFSVFGNRQLLRQAGFQDIEIVFRSIPFTGFLAIK